MGESRVDCRGGARRGGCVRSHGPSLRAWVGSGRARWCHTLLGRMALHVRHPYQALPHRFDCIARAKIKKAFTTQLNEDVLASCQKVADAERRVVTSVIVFEYATTKSIEINSGPKVYRWRGQPLVRSLAPKNASCSRSRVAAAPNASSRLAKTFTSIKSSLSPAAAQTRLKTPAAPSAVQPAEGRHGACYPICASSVSCWSKKLVTRTNISYNVAVLPKSISVIAGITRNLHLVR